MPKILMKAVVLAGLVIFIACSPSISCLSPEEKRLENATIGDHSPEWMPDGTAIITHADSRLWMVPVDGSAIERIGSRDRGQLKAAVSPTGMLAYTEERPLRSSCRLDRGCRRVMLKIARWGPESTDLNPAFQVTADYDMAWSSYDRLATISRSGTITLSTHAGNYASVPPLISPNRPVSRKDHRITYISDAKGPAWSRNGDFVATVVLDRGKSQTRPGPWQWFLFLLRSDGAYQKVIPLSPEFKDHRYPQFSEMSAPAWSQDLKRIYYAMRLPDENVPVLYAVELESGDTQVIATLEPEPGPYEAVKMSPTGEQLLLVSRSVNHYAEVGEASYSEPVDGALYTIQSDGQNLRRIWQGYAHASWSPDGQNIAVWTPLLPDDTWLWLIDPTGAVRTPLIKRNEDGDPVAASPP